MSVKYEPGSNANVSPNIFDGVNADAIQNSDKLTQSESADRVVTYMGKSDVTERENGPSGNLTAEPWANKSNYGNPGASQEMHGRRITEDCSSPSTKARRHRQIEVDQVHKVYQQIAPYCDQVRQKAWPRVKRFLKDLQPGSVVADVGCGNGRYLSVNSSILKIGCDTCSPFLQQARNSGHEVMMADNIALPYRDAVFDAVISVGVIHHLASLERRTRAIAELSRILCPGGRLMVYVWAFEQIHRKFESQDVLIPWVNPEVRDNVRRHSGPCSSESDSASAHLMDNSANLGSTPVHTFKRRRHHHHHHDRSCTINNVCGERLRSKSLEGHETMSNERSDRHLPGSLSKVKQFGVFDRRDGTYKAEKTTKEGVAFDWSNGTEKSITNIAKEEYIFDDKHSSCSAKTTSKEVNIFDSRSDSNKDTNIANDGAIFDLKERTKKATKTIKEEEDTRSNDSVFRESSSSSPGAGRSEDETDASSEDLKVRQKWPNQLVSECRKLGQFLRRLSSRSDSQGDGDEENTRTVDRNDDIQQNYPTSVYPVKYNHGKEKSCSTINSNTLTDSAYLNNTDVTISRSQNDLRITSEDLYNQLMPCTTNAAEEDSHIDYSSLTRTPSKNVSRDNYGNNIIPKTQVTSSHNITIGSSVLAYSTINKIKTTTSKAHNKASIISRDELGGENEDQDDRGQDTREVASTTDRLLLLAAVAVSSSADESDGASSENRAGSSPVANTLSESKDASNLEKHPEAKTNLPTLGSVKNEDSVFSYLDKTVKNVEIDGKSNKSRNYEDIHEVIVTQNILYSCESNEKNLVSQSVSMTTLDGRAPNKVNQRLPSISQACVGVFEHQGLSSPATKENAKSTFITKGGNSIIPTNSDNSTVTIDNDNSNIKPNSIIITNTHTSTLAHAETRLQNPTDSAAKEVNKESSGLNETTDMVDNGIRFLESISNKSPQDRNTHIQVSDNNLRNHQTVGDKNHPLQNIDSEQISGHSYKDSADGKNLTRYESNQLSDNETANGRYSGVMVYQVEIPNQLTFKTILNRLADVFQLRSGSESKTVGCYQTRSRHIRKYFSDSDSSDTETPVSSFSTHSSCYPGIFKASKENSSKDDHSTDTCGTTQCFVDNESFEFICESDLLKETENSRKAGNYHSFSSKSHTPTVNNLGYAPTKRGSLIQILTDKWSGMFNKGNYSHAMEENYKHYSSLLLPDSPMEPPLISLRQGNNSSMLGNEPEYKVAPKRPTSLDFTKKRTRTKGRRPVPRRETKSKNVKDTKCVENKAKELEIKKAKQLTLSEAMTLLGDGETEDSVFSRLDESAKTIFSEMKRMNFAIRKFPMSSVDSDSNDEVLKENTTDLTQKESDKLRKEDTISPSSTKHKDKQSVCPHLKFSDSVSSSGRRPKRTGISQRQKEIKETDSAVSVNPLQKQFISEDVATFCDNLKTHHSNDNSSSAQSQNHAVETDNVPSSQTLPQDNCSSVRKNSSNHSLVVGSDVGNITSSLVTKVNKSDFMNGCAKQKLSVMLNSNEPTLINLPTKNSSEKGKINNDTKQSEMRKNIDQSYIVNDDCASNGHDTYLRAHNQLDSVAKSNQLVKCNSASKNAESRKLNGVQSKSDSRLSRYYHVFKKGELDLLVTNHVPSLKIVDTFYDHANWCIIAEKK